MTQSFTRFLRMLSVVLLTAVCTTRLGATAVVSNLTHNAGSLSMEFTSSVLTTTPGDNEGIPGVAPTVNLAPVNALCYNAKNGSIVTTVIGDAPFTYAWSNGKTTQNLNNIGAGTYTVTVTDTDGESTVSSTNVGQPAAIIAYINCMNVCPGTCNGFANLTVLSGGTAPYTYQWSTGATSQDIDGLCAGIYWVTITDANGCKKIVGAAVTVSSAVVISGVATNATCADPCSGTITQNVSGAIAPYTYAWSNGASTKNLTGLCAGIYTVTVTSHNGCTATATYEISAPPPVDVEVIPTNPLCYGQTGSLSANASGGTAPVSYIWSNGLTSNSIDVTDGDTYCVTVTDANGCTADGCGAVVFPTQLVVSIVDSCLTGSSLCTGSATAVASGGTGDLFYIWSNGATSATIENLCNGTYTVVVNDANQCTATATDSINCIPPPCNPPATITGTPLCGETSVTLSVAGGFNDSTAIYQWSQAGVPGVLGTDATFVVSSNGTYYVSITDLNTPCISVDSIDIVLLPNPSVEVSTTPVSCYGGENGTATATATGGTGDYSYIWNTGSVDANITGLVAGNYCVTVYDANQCSATDCGEVTQPNALNIDIIGTNGTCTNPCAGAIEVSANGGTAPYTYVWSDSTFSGSFIDDVCAGTYCVTVVDANGCSNWGCVTITAPTGVDVTVTSTNPSCFGYTNGTASATAVGGTAPYTYNWSNGSTTANLINIGGGSYTVTVTDANGCTATGTVNVVAPPKIVAYVNCIKTCPGVCSGAANLTVIGGTPPYSYNWSNGATTQDIDSLCVGVYWVTITDANGCQKIVGAAVLSLPPVVINGTVTNVLCSGSCSGGITLSVSGGGAGAYTYLWSNGSTVKNQTQLCTGEYCVTVTSSHGCTASACFEVTSTPPVEVVVETESPLCAPGSGSASASVSGGAAPFSYVWSNGSTESSINGLEAGNYCVTVTDANGCTATDCGDVTVPEILTVNAEGTSPLCAPGSGSADATATGGTGVISYAWSNGSTDASIDGLETGTYCVTVTDENGCTATDCVEILVPTVLVVDVDANDQLCFGDDLGSVTSTVSGGTPPYSYNWSNGATTENIEGLGFGIYTLVVTDANGCTAMDMDIVVSPLPLAAVAIPLPATCYGYDNGSIDLMVMGGTVPYTYNWSNGATTQDIENLVAGTYSVTITDAHQCSTTASAEVMQPTEVVATATSTNLNCYGICDGTASVSAVGGVTIFGIYTYAWSNGATTDELTELCAGTYTVTVTDLVGCFDVVSVEISQPTPLQVSADPTDASCPEACDGAATVSISGGTPGYTVNWSNGAVGGEVMELCAGTYTFTVTDENGCTAEGTVTIEAPITLVVNSNATDVTCYNGFDGTVTATANGGTAPYTIVWTGGSTDWTLTDLAAGIYCFTVTDANGCTASACDTVNEPEPLLAYSECPVMILCPGDCTGIIDVTVVGGTPPYTYEWSDGATTEDRDSLCAGFYGVTITDANGCTFDLLHVMENPTPLTVTNESTDVTCYEACDGSITVFATGGTGIVTIAWANGDSAWSVSGLCAGTYCFTVTDANGCTYSDCVTIEQPELVTVSSDATDVTCYNGFDGTVTVVANGGTAPYAIVWADGSNDWTLTDLAAGTYCFTVTDANGCTATGCETVNEPEPLQAYSECPVMILCPGDCTGEILVTVVGGTPPYSYEWSDGATTEDRDSLCPGFYGVTITDANGCTFDLLHVMENPTPLTATYESTNVTCYEACDGSISVFADGGTGLVSIAWANGDSAWSVTGLCAGTYCFTVTDANGCTYSDCVTITQPEQLTVVVTGVDVLCPTGSNAATGSASALATGGTGDYIYIWNTGATTASIEGLATGTYCVTVYDANQCSATDCDDVDAPAPLEASATSTDITCYGIEDGTITVTASGGTAPYAYAWANGNTTNTGTGLGFGTYQITVTDANGCTAVAEATIEEPTQLVAEANPTDVTCYGYCDGAATVSISGGTPGYTVIWSDSALVGGEVMNLCAGTYSFTVTDANGCTTEGSVTINAPEELAVVVVPTNILCADDNNGEVSVTVSGGTPAYAIVWADGATDFTIGGLAPGEYCFTVTDANGCSTEGCASIFQPEALIAFSVCPDTVLCPDACNGSILVTASGGVPPYTYEWNDGSTDEDRFELCAGIYIVTITDANGCEFILAHELAGSDPIEANTSSTDDSNCFLNGPCNASGSVTPSGGVAPFAIVWSNGSTDAIVNGLCSSELGITYYVTITDANECSVVDSITVYCQPPLPCNPPITISGTVECGQTSVELTIDGVVDPALATYLWNNGATTESIIVNTNGTYSVTVTVTDDSTFLCTSIDSFSVEFISAPTASTVSSDVTCYNSWNGSINLTIDGGTAPYTINWSNGSNSEDLSGLANGIYCYTVVDANGCSASGCDTINEPEPLLGYVDCPCNYFLCPGECTAAIDLTVVGGAAPFSFEWNNGATTEDLANLCIGDYVVTISDANGCTFEVYHAPFEEAENCDSTTTPLDIFGFSVFNDTDCGDETCDGVIVLTISGGVQPYSYNWSNGATDGTLTDLCEGMYSYTVTDAAGTSAWNMLNVGCNDNTPVRMAEGAATDNVIVNASPNPFSVNSSIHFALPVDDSNVTLEVYSVTGQKVAELFRGSVKANATYDVTLDGGQLADGMYIYRLLTSSGAYTGNLVRVKN